MSVEEQLGWPDAKDCIFRSAILRMDHSMDELMKGNADYRKQQRAEHGAMVEADVSVGPDAREETGQEECSNRQGQELIAERPRLADGMPVLVALQKVDSLGDGTQRESQGVNLRSR